MKDHQDVKNAAHALNVSALDLYLAIYEVKRDLIETCLLG